MLKRASISTITEQSVMKLQKILKHFNVLIFISSIFVQISLFWYSARIAIQNSEFRDVLDENKNNYIFNIVFFSANTTKEIKYFWYKVSFSEILFFLFRWQITVKCQILIHRTCKTVMCWQALYGVR